jgi:Poly(R)-hydroxyalkanoic acid synthase subunit (PHA_synth_III_E)
VLQNQYFIYFFPKEWRMMSSNTTPSSNIFLDLLNMQMNVVKSAANAASGILPDNVTTMVTDLANTITASAENIGSSFTMPKGPASSSSSNSFSLSGFPFNLGNMGESFNMLSQLMSLYDTSKNLYGSWMGAMGKLPAAVSDLASGATVITNAVNGVNDMAQTYFKMSEVLLPVMNAIQSTGLNKDTLEKYLNFDQYNKLVGGLFNLAGPDVMEKFSNQILNLLGQLGEAGGLAGPTVKDMTDQSLKAMGEMASGNYDAAAKIYVGMIDNIQKPTSPLVNMVFFGRDRVAVELTQEMLKSYVMFAAHYAKIQQLILSTGKDAIIDLTARVSEAAKSGKAPQTFDEFFNVWIRTNEAAFDKMFSTDDYARVQGEIATSSAKVKEHTDKFFELMISEFPIAKRSELDEAHQSIHFLKSQVRRLERKLNEQEEAIEELQGGVKSESAKLSAPKTATKPVAKAAPALSAAKKPAAKKPATKK